MVNETKEKKEIKETEATKARPELPAEPDKRVSSRRGFIKGAGLAGAAVTAGVAGLGAVRPVSASSSLQDSTCGVATSASSANAVSAKEMQARYQRAEQLYGSVGNPREVVLNATIYPHWIGDSDHFWYVRETRNGQQYRLVDAAARRNEPAFDHRALARSLSKLSGEKVDPENLPLKNVDLALSPRTVKFKAFDGDWEYNDNTKRCKKLDYPLSPPWVVSPDGKRGAFVRDYNLWVRDIASGKERALTQDGERFYEYASTTTWYGRPERPGLIDLVWSPDSKRILTQMRDTRQIRRAALLVDYLPEDGSLPKIIDPDRRRALPNDEHQEAWTLLSVEVQNGAIQWFDCPPQVVSYPHYYGVFGRKQGWWLDNRYACFIYQDTGDFTSGLNTQVLKLDSHTGETSILFREDPESYFQFIPNSHLECPALSLPESNEVIWWSDRSGWTHLYLYETDTGRLKKTITQGDWMVRNILHYDAGKRELLIQTAGRVKARNPYYRDICRVNIDTGELTTVLSSNHEYVVCDPRDRIAFLHKAAGTAPSGRYFVATRSRVDEVPVSLMLDRNGREVMTLETADVHGMPRNWHPPEPVMVKAADGKTDIYAAITRPPNFSPDKSYPIIDFTWGPGVGAFSNDSMGFINVYPAAYAALGFVVVQVAGRGKSIIRPTLRSKSFRNYTREIDTPFAQMDRADAIAAIKQLAQRYSCMDIDRVGVVDPAVSQGALNGLLVYPEFYKVGIANNPSLREPEYEDVIQNLRGKLLLIGMLKEEAVPISGFFRLLDALQQAGKRFDLMIDPHLGHGPISSEYGKRLIWDYLVTHLLGVEPPTGKTDEEQKNA